MVSPCLNSGRVGTWPAGELGRRHLPAFRSQPRPALFYRQLAEKCDELFHRNSYISSLLGHRPYRNRAYFTDFQNCKDFMGSRFAGLNRLRTLTSGPDGVVRCPRYGAEANDQSS
jgi:hypothetical protein